MLRQGEILRTAKEIREALKCNTFHVIYKATPNGKTSRVMNARLHYGQLQVRLMQSNEWFDYTGIAIVYVA